MARPVGTSGHHTSRTIFSGDRTGKREAVTVDEFTDYEIAEAMLTGGSFVYCLGRAWYSADESNRARLKAAFPEYWERYTEVARQSTAKAKA